LYCLWHDEWSVGLWQRVRRHAHLPRWYWRPARNH
jgi:hypothetical protein